MEFTKQEKETLKFIIKKELKKVEEEENYLNELRPDITFLAAEEKYENLLKEILKKLD